MSRPPPDAVPPVVDKGGEGGGVVALVGWAEGVAEALAATEVAGEKVDAEGGCGGGRCGTKGACGGGRGAGRRMPGTWREWWERGWSGGKGNEASESGTPAAVSGGGMAATGGRGTDTDEVEGASTGGAAVAERFSLWPRSSPTMNDLIFPPLPPFSSRGEGPCVAARVVRGCSTAQHKTHTTRPTTRHTAWR
jgi:hypothetical protein